MTELVSGKLEITITALDSIHHGSGVAGNTSLLRVQEIVTPDGKHCRVPWISGNSLKHMIRESGALFALEVMGAEPQSLSKGVVDLLFSGGHLSKGGVAVDLAQARKMCELFPILSVCGFSAGNIMQEAKIKVDNLHMCCSENAWRLPERLTSHHYSSMRAGAFRGEEFGTRHENKSPKIHKYLTEKAVAMLEDKASSALKRSRSGETSLGKKDETTLQMIFEFQIIKPGAVFWGCIYMHELTELEAASLVSALSYACEGKQNESLLYRLGAKGSAGWGKVAIDFHGSTKLVVTEPQYRDDSTLVPQKGRYTDSVKKYIQHLQEKKGEIVENLEAFA